MPVVPAEPLAGAPEHSPIPLADQIAGFAVAVRERAGATRSGLSEGIHGGVGRVLDLMPRRKTGYRRVRTASDTEENRKRASYAAIALVAIIIVLGGLVWYLGPFRSDTPCSTTRPMALPH